MIIASQSYTDDGEIKDTGQTMVEDVEDKSTRMEGGNRLLGKLSNLM